MVGAPRFELGTSCSQSRRATRLRHAPSINENTWEVRRHASKPGTVSPTGVSAGRVSLHAAAWGSVMGLIFRAGRVKEGQMSHRCFSVVLTVIASVALFPLFAAAQSTGS